MDAATAGGDVRWNNNVEIRLQVHRSTWEIMLRGNKYRALTFCCNIATVADEVDRMTIVDRNITTIQLGSHTRIQQIMRQCRLKVLSHRMRHVALRRHRANQTH